MSIQEEIRQAKKLFVEKDDVRAMNLNGEPYIMGKWSELEAYLKSALQRMQGNVGQNKRIAYQLGLKERQIAYQLGFKEGQDETAEKICVIIDKIESQSETTLEEWKQYKHIRNAIRDKFILREKLGKAKG